jgi:hypothetical protein
VPVRPLSSGPARAGAIDAAAALSQLAGRAGQMARLCSENGTVRMDWVDSVEALLADERPLVEVEDLAESWRRRGVRHVVWSGMGGSGVTVGVLAELGLGEDGRGPTIHLLDSTDPAALDALVERLAPPGGGDARPEDLRAVLRDVVLVAVSLGVTSEEPATHLAWYLGLLEAAGLAADRHTVVLTVPGSRLEEAAARSGLEARPVYLADRGGLPGRMSAPSSCVFLLPVALRRAGPAGPGLRAVLEQAWAAHELEATVEDPARSPYVRFAVALAARTRGHRCRLMLALPAEWAPLHAWIEQLFEQTLGKAGKGVVVLPPQRLNRAAPGHRDDDLVVAEPGAEDGLALPLPDVSDDPFAALATAMLGWQVVVALLGHHAGTNIVDEPAVEDYKARARTLRGEAAVLALAVAEGALDWPARGPDGLERVVDSLVTSASRRELSYLDVTINGELDAPARGAAAVRLQRLGNELLGVPVKLRRAPAAYHISEQCQLDGPPGVVSLRVVARTTRSAGLGGYTPRFLHAQAVATWQAMNASGRDCTLVVVDRLDDVVEVLAATEDALRARLGTPAGALGS